MRVTLGGQQVGQFLRTGGGVLGPFQAHHHQPLQCADGQVKATCVVLAGVVVDGLLADGQRHAFFHSGIKINQPRSFAAQQRLGRACVQPVGRQQQLVRNALAPDAEHFASTRRVANGAPTVRQQHSAGVFGFGADGLKIWETGYCAFLAQLVKVVRRGGANHPGGTSATKDQRQVARDACGVVFIAAKARLPIVRAALQLVAGQGVGVLDGVQVVRVDTHAQAVGLPRREVACFKPHRQQGDRLPAVHRFDHLRGIPLAKQAVGKAVDVG